MTTGRGWLNPRLVWENHLSFWKIIIWLLWIFGEKILSNKNISVSFFIFKAVLSIRKDLKMCFFSSFFNYGFLWIFWGLRGISNSVEKPKIFPNFLEGHHGGFSFVCLPRSKNATPIIQAGVHKYENMKTPTSVLRHIPYMVVASWFPVQDQNQQSWLCPL